MQALRVGGLLGEATTFFFGNLVPPLLELVKVSSLVLLHGIFEYGALERAIEVKLKWAYNVGIISRYSGVKYQMGIPKSEAYKGKCIHDWNSF